MAHLTSEDALPDIRPVVFYADLGTEAAGAQDPEKGGDVGDEARVMGSSPCYLITVTMGSCLKKGVPSPGDLRRELGANVIGAETRHIVVLYGLQADYAHVLNDELGVQADISSAANRRHRYQSRTGGTAVGASVTFYEYPELVGHGGTNLCDAGIMDKLGEDGVPSNLMGSPLGAGWLNSMNAVLFFEATLWRDEKIDVLLLSGSLSSDSLPALKQSANVPGGLGGRLCEFLDEQDSAVSTLAAVEQIVLERWTEFLDNFQLDLNCSAVELTAIFWKVQRGLERNMNQSCRSSQGRVKAGNLQADWQALLDRAERHRRLFLDLRSLSLQTEVLRPEVLFRRRSATQPEGGEKKNPSQVEENLRSLDRVSYIGGFLLPISIVSGILSMGDTFGPRGDLFYVFWALAVPLTILTVVIIYADTIRRKIVWVEVSVSGASSVHASEGFNHHFWRGKHRKPGTTSMPNLEQGTHYSYSEPMALPVSEHISMPERLEETQSVSSGPVLTLESRFCRESRPKVWTRQELGWIGAAKCILQLSRVKKMQSLPLGARKQSDTYTST